MVLPVPAPASPEAPRSGLLWTAGRALLRIVIAVVLYRLYAYARNENGLSEARAAAVARRHGRHLSSIEGVLGLPSEHALQASVLGHVWFVRLCGAYYGTAHFLVTAGVILLLAVRRPRAFDRWAATLAVTTFLAVGCFALHPVAPPRLIPGATVDTLATLGGVLSYDHGVLEHISDPYAALPSLHLAWATWCALVVWEGVAPSPRRRLWRALGVGHVLATLVVVLVTGNHWYLDAVAGTALVLAVWAVQAALLRARARRSAPGPVAPAETATPSPAGQASGARAL